MGEQYGHITLEERCEIARRLQAGETQGQIAAALGRSSSAISRELRRNRTAQGYKPAHASDLAWARR
jgi:IS30 family transposase